MKIVTLHLTSHTMSSVVIEDVYPWSIWCVTEGAWVTGPASTAPTTCFTNAAHTVDTATHTVRRHVSLMREIPFVHTPSSYPNITWSTVIRGVEVRNDATNTNLLERFSVSEMVWTSPPYPIALAGIQCNLAQEQSGDVLDMWVHRNVAVPGLVLTAGTSAGDSVFTVASVAAFRTGLQLAIDGEELGEIIDVDTATKRVKTSAATALEHNIGAQVTFSTYIMRGVTLGARGDGGGRVTLGEFTPGSMIVAANTPVTVQYTNNHNRRERLDLLIEYQYGSVNLGTIV